MIDRHLAPLDWNRPLSADDYIPPQTKWNNRTDFAPFRAINAALDLLSDLYTLTSLYATQDHRDHPPLRRLLSSLTHNLFKTVKFTYYSVQFILLCCFVIIVSPALVWEVTSRAYFACRAFLDSFIDFKTHVCRAHAPHELQFQTDVNEGLNRPWHFSNKVLDQLLEAVIWTLDSLSLAIPGASLHWRGPEHREEFRRYLGQRPPAFAVQCYDYTYLMDKTSNPCQITALLTLERSDLKSIREVFHKEWVCRHPKMRSVLSFRHGCYCWVPLHVSPDPQDIEPPFLPLPPPEERLLRTGNHIFEADLDLSKESIYMTLSKMSSVCLRRDRPLWRVCLFQPTNADMSVRVGDKALPATSISFLALHFHHSLADGVGLVHTVTTTIFKAESEALREQSIGRAHLALSKHRGGASLTASGRQPPLIHVAAFYLYHFLRSLSMAIGQISFWFFWAPTPPALFQNRPDACEISANGTRADGPQPLLRPRSEVTGRRFLSTPIVFSKEEVLQACADIGKMIGVKPTLNDLFSACIASAVGRMRSGQVTAEIKRQLLADKGEPETMTRGTPTATPSNRLTSGHKMGSLTPFHKFGSGFSDYAQILIPMTARVSVPQAMDNFTSVVLTRFPLPSAICQQEKIEREAGLWRRVVRFISGDPSVSLSRVIKGGCSQVPILETEDASVLVQMRHLLTVKSEMDWLKRQNARILFFSAICAMCRAFPDGLLRFVFTALSSNIQVIFTNVCGPSVKGKVGGQSLLSISSWVPMSGDVTIAVQIVTYDEEIQLLVTADECEAGSMFTAQELARLSRKDLMAATSIIGQVIWQEMQKLKQAAQAAPSASEGSFSPGRSDTTPAADTSRHSLTGESIAS